MYVKPDLSVDHCMCQSPSFTRPHCIDTPLTHPFVIITLTNPPSFNQPPPQPTLSSLSPLLTHPLIIDTSPTHLVIIDTHHIGQQGSAENLETTEQRAQGGGVGVSGTSEDLDV